MSKARMGYLGGLILALLAAVWNLDLLIDGKLDWIDAGVYTAIGALVREIFGVSLKLVRTGNAGEEAAGLPGVTPVDEIPPPPPRQAGMNGPAPTELRPNPPSAPPRSG